MKKIVEQLQTNKKIHYGIIIAIGLILSIPILEVIITKTHDGFIHLLRLYGTNLGMESGQFPSMIVQKFCNGDGYSMNLFYPPLVTYLPLCFKLFTSSYAMALKLFAMLTIVLSGVTMYQCTYQITKKRSMALFAGILYMAAPYKLGDINVRFAIGEFTAFIFIPYVFLGLHSLLKEDGKKHYYIAIGAAGLMLTHTISTMYTAIFSAIYVCVYWKKLKEVEVIKKLLINVIFILLISTMFLLPMLEATGNADYALLNDKIFVTNNEYVSSHTIQFSQFFHDIGEENGTTFVIGMATVILIIASIYCFFKMDKTYRKEYITFFAFAMLSLIMCTSLFPWEHVPIILCKLQYPWRMLGFFIFFIDIICGINASILIQKTTPKSGQRVFLGTVIILFTLISTLPAYEAFHNRYKDLDPNLDKIYEEKMTNIERMSHFSINRDYLPTNAILQQETYMMQRKEEIYVLKGKATVVTQEKNGLTMEATIQEVEKDTILEFPYIYYPGYEVTIEQNGTSKTIKAEASVNGYICIVIPDQIDKADLHIRYDTTILTKVSYLVSIISIFGLAIYVISEKRKEKKSDV